MLKKLFDLGKNTEALSSLEQKFWNTCLLAECCQGRL